MKHIHIFIIRYNNIDSNFQDTQFKRICFKLLIDLLKVISLLKIIKKFIKK